MYLFGNRMHISKGKDKVMLFPQKQTWHSQYRMNKNDRTFVTTLKQFFPSDYYNKFVYVQKSIMTLQENAGKKIL